MPHPADNPDPSADPARSLSPGRLGLVLLVAAMLAFWVWIFVAAPRDNPDRFDDPAFALAAEPLCAAAQARIDALPAGHTAAGPAERAVTVREGTVLTVQMVDSLRGLAAEIPAGEQTDTLAEWFSDWDVYIADRWAHVERLESADSETEARDLAFVVSEVVGGGHYTRRIDGLANVNDMRSCHVPLDI